MQGCEYYFGGVPLARNDEWGGEEEWMRELKDVNNECKQSNRESVKWQGGSGQQILSATRKARRGLIPTTPTTQTLQCRGECLLTPDIATDVHFVTDHIIAGVKACGHRRYRCHWSLPSLVAQGGILTDWV